MRIFSQPPERVWIKRDPRTWEYDYAFNDNNGKRYLGVSVDLGNQNLPNPAARVRIVKKDCWAIDMPASAAYMWGQSWTTVTTVESYDEATGIAQLLVATKEKANERV